MKEKILEKTIIRKIKYALEKVILLMQIAYRKF